MDSPLDSEIILPRHAIVPFACSKQGNYPFTYKRREPGAIVFRCIPNFTKQSHHETKVTFEFRNDTRHVVFLPTTLFTGPKDGVLRVHFTVYEFQVAGKWESLGIGYDGIPNYIPVEPGNELRLVIDLGVFEYHHVSRDAPLRVRLCEFTSDVFTLNSAIGGKTL